MTLQNEPSKTWAQWSNKQLPTEVEWICCMRSEEVPSQLCTVVYWPLFIQSADWGYQLPVSSLRNSSDMTDWIRRAQEVLKAVKRHVIVKIDHFKMYISFSLTLHQETSDLQLTQLWSSNPYFSFYGFLLFQMTLSQRNVYSDQCTRRDYPDYCKSTIHWHDRRSRSTQLTHTFKYMTQTERCLL